MTSLGHDAFVFDFTHFIFADKGMWTLTNEPELRLLGRLVRGNITKGNSITVPTAEGLITGIIIQFMERLGGWDALPFYERVTPDTTSFSFCLVIMDIPSESVPLCPGTAYPGTQA